PDRHCDLHSVPTRRSSDLTLTTSWQRFSCVGQVNSPGDTTASFRIRVLFAAQGETFYVRRVIGVVANSQAEAEAGIATYWDGDTDRKSTRLNSSHVKISYA